MIKLKNLIEMATPTIENKSQTWYHGTDSELAGQSILKDGFIKPPEITFKRSKQLTPVKGKVYITPRLDYALIYSLGGDVVGGNLDGWKSVDRSGEYGYLFVIDGNDLKDIQPDEDEIGKIPMFDHNNRYKTEPFDDFTKNLFKNNMISNMLWMCKRYMTSTQYRKSMEGEVAYQAAGGKRVISKMEDLTKLKLISMGCHVAHGDVLKISQCWRFHKKRDNVKLKKDGSNFFDIAERIK